MIKFIKHAYNFNAVKVVENRRFLLEFNFIDNENHFLKKKNR